MDPGETYPEGMVPCIPHTARTRKLWSINTWSTFTPGIWSSAKTEAPGNKYYGADYNSELQYVKEFHEYYGADKYYGALLRDSGSSKNLEHPYSFRERAVHTEYYKGAASL